MKNLYLLSALLVGTFLSVPAFAGDYEVTADQLNAATPHFTWEEVNDMSTPGAAVADDWDNTGYVNIVDYDNAPYFRTFRGL